MAQSNYKTVKEAKGLQVGDLVQDFSAKDLHDSTFTLSEAFKKRSGSGYLLSWTMVPGLQQASEYFASQPSIDI